MDYYKNFDQIDQSNTQPAVSGIAYEVVTDIPTANEPVTLDFFKEHARIDFDTDDTLASVYIKAARQYLEKYCQKSFGPKTMRIRALTLPENWRLAFGPVKTIETTGYTNFGDHLVEGGEKLEVEYTTDGIMDDAIRVAICKYAAGLYISRENVDTELDSETLFDSSKSMLQPYKMITLF